ncbi:MAG TPA: helix-turn-helix transcriptional regulator [Sphingobacteriaceae bacterium]
MKNQDFAKKLRAERDRLGYSQKKVSKLLFMTQPSYSRIERNLSKPNVDRMQEMVDILSNHGFNLPPVQLERWGDKLAMIIHWPFHRYSLYGLLVLLGIMLFDYILHIPEDLARGYGTTYAGKPDESPTIAAVLDVVLPCGIIYGLYRFIKWCLSKKS